MVVACNLIAEFVQPNAINVLGVRKKKKGMFFFIARWHFSVIALALAQSVKFRVWVTREGPILWRCFFVFKVWIAIAVLFLKIVFVSVVTFWIEWFLSLHGSRDCPCRNTVPLSLLTVGAKKAFWPCSTWGYYSTMRRMNISRIAFAVLSFASLWFSFWISPSRKYDFCLIWRIVFVTFSFGFVLLSLWLFVVDENSCNRFAVFVRPVTETLSEIYHALYCETDHSAQPCGGLV